MPQTIVNAIIIIITIIIIVIMVSLSPLVRVVFVVSAKKPLLREKRKALMVLLLT